MFPKNWIAEFIQDTRYGIRALSKSWALSAIAIGSLALGIGATTSIYSVIYAVILDPFPYKDVDSLMSIAVREPGRRGTRTYYTVDQFLEIEKRNSIFEGVVTSTISDIEWTGAGDPVRLRGNHVTMNTFAVLGVPPLLGRATTQADAEPGAEPVAILGYKFWQRQFGGDPGVLGRKLRLNDKIRTVVGVMPPRFMWRGADVYIPLVFHRGEIAEGVRDVHVLGRLKPGITEAQAEADLRPIIEELRRQNPRNFPEKWRVSLLPFKETFPSGIREALWILFGAVGLLLLIACVNVSNLLLSKAVSRAKEIAVRASLGASRGRLIRQLLAESMILGIAGGFLGVWIAYAGLTGILAIVPPYTIPDESKVSINIPVLLFALGISFVSALLFGLAPAIQTSGGDLATPLKEAGRGSSGGARKARLHSALVIGEVALSLMLLVGASLMIRTLFAMQNLNLGIQPDRILSMRIPLSDKRYPDSARKNAFLSELLRRARNVPGVASAALNSGLHPLGNWSAPVEIPGAAQQDDRPVLLQQTSESYPRTLGIPLIRGRMFTEQEVANRSHVALVNETFARRYFSNQEPLGRVVRIPRLRTPLFNVSDDSFQIVGVTRDAVNRLLANETFPEVYFPYTITAMADRLVVSTQAPPATLGKTLRAQVYAIDKDQPVTDIETIEEVLHNQIYAGPRFNLLLFGIFAGLGLFLAVVGLYGVVSSGVSQRTNEIGIRIALGASFRDVIAMILSQGANLLGIGIVVGLAGSLLSVRVLAGEVWKLSTFDPYSFFAVSLLLFAAGLCACYWPARRAARVDPVTALRHE